MDLGYRVAVVDAAATVTVLDSSYRPATMSVYEGLKERARAVEERRELEMFTLLVTGSRHATDADMVWTPLFLALVDHRQMIVRHGACPQGGVDELVAAWCRLPGQPWNCDPHSELLVLEDPMPADWERWGKAAGPRRNQEMVDKGASACYAFPDSRHRSGTLDCLARAWARGMPCYVFSSIRVGAFHRVSEGEGLGLARRMLGWGS